jgi:hypothetical protein
MKHLNLSPVIAIAILAMSSCRIDPPVDPVELNRRLLMQQQWEVVNVIPHDPVYDLIDYQVWRFDQNQVTIVSSLWGLTDTEYFSYDLTGVDRMELDDTSIEYSVSSSRLTINDDDVTIVLQPW